MWRPHVSCQPCSDSVRATALCPVLDRPSRRPRSTSAQYTRRSVGLHLPVAVAVSCCAVSAELPAWARAGQQEVAEGMQRFKAGDVKGSVASFDRALEVNPGSRPYLWQRGLSLYYAEDYEKAAQQFRDDVGVNPNDTEEAIWAYLSECRTLGVDTARQQLLKVGRDVRPVLRGVYEAIGAGTLPEYKAANAQEEFYLALYRGLLLEAECSPAASAAEIQKAVQSRYAQKGRDYMIAVASVHCSMRAACSA